MGRDRQTGGGGGGGGERGEKESGTETGRRRNVQIQ